MLIKNDCLVCKKQDEIIVRFIPELDILFSEKFRYDSLYKKLISEKNYILSSELYSKPGFITSFEKMYAKNHEWILSDVEAVIQYLGITTPNCMVIDICKENSTKYFIETDGNQYKSVSKETIDNKSLKEEIAGKIGCYLNTETTIDEFFLLIFGYQFAKETNKLTDAYVKDNIGPELLNFIDSPEYRSIFNSEFDLSILINTISSSILNFLSRFNIPVNTIIIGPLTAFKLACDKLKDTYYNSAHEFDLLQIDPELRFTKNTDECQILLYPSPIYFHPPLQCILWLTEESVVEIRRNKDSFIGKIGLQLSKTSDFLLKKNYCNYTKLKIEIDIDIYDNFHLRANTIDDIQFDLVLNKN